MMPKIPSKKNTVKKPTDLDAEIELVLAKAVIWRELAAHMKLLGQVVRDVLEEQKK